MSEFRRIPINKFYTTVGVSLVNLDKRCYGKWLKSGTVDFTSMSLTAAEHCTAAQPYMTDNATYSRHTCSATAVTWWNHVTQCIDLINANILTISQNDRISHHCELNNMNSMFTPHCGHSIYGLSFKSNIGYVYQIYTPQAADEDTTQPTPETIVRHNLRMNESSLLTDRIISSLRDLKYLQPGGFSFVSALYSACQTPEIYTESRIHERSDGVLERSVKGCLTLMRWGRTVLPTEGVRG